ncbi:MAG TPA: hybrid sensor histidine kinase/response regulator, partial [Bacteroidia bacterium]|nr:hybrid sensor histidine kinase/response regulator [Bacteroidia bacterium]
MSPIRILILEDNPADIDLVRRELKQAGYNAIYYLTDSREQFIDGLHRFRPELVLSDHSLPQFNSIEALHLVQKFDPDIPFILVTGAVSEEFAVQVIKEGADDYILKDHLIRLPSAITNAIRKKAAEKERNQMLEQLLFTNNELNTFVYKATHDLRGPLTSIMGLINLATRSENQHQVQTFIRMIEESTLKLDAVLVSLIETMAIKNARLSFEQIDFDEILRLVLDKLSLTPGFGSVRFETEIHSKNSFRSDKKILVAIIQNLVENAVKYKNKVEPKPFVHLRITDFEDGIRLEIADNGIGIDPQIQGKIFDMFYRGNESSEGAGLGLYLVKNGVQRLGGMINMKSERGVG